MIKFPRGSTVQPGLRTSISRVKPHYVPGPQLSPLTVLNLSFPICEPQILTEPVFIEDLPCAMDFRPLFLFCSPSRPHETHVTLQTPAALGSPSILTNQGAAAKLLKPLPHPPGLSFVSGSVGTVPTARMFRAPLNSTCPAPRAQEALHAPRRMHPLHLLNKHLPWGETGLLSVL